MKKLLIIMILVPALLLAGCGNLENKNPSSNGVSQPQVGGLDWNTAFEKNTEIENTYKETTSLPSHHTLCVPVKKFACNVNACTSVEPKVFNLIGGTRDDSNISRCDSIGCDTYETTFDDSGEYKNINLLSRRGFCLKWHITQ